MERDRQLKITSQYGKCSCDDFPRGSESIDAEGMDVQWVLLRSFQFYFRMIKTVGVKNKKPSEMHSGPELLWV